MDFQKRFRLVEQPRVRPLSDFRCQLLASLPSGSFVPNFDPLDGGIAARILLLLETPGRVPRQTRFTSLDNPSSTSKNLLPMVLSAGLKRSDVLMWNLVPWDVGTKTKVRPTTDDDRSKGTQALFRLLGLLPRLRSIVFFGTNAQKAMATVNKEHPDLNLLRSPHPSPTNLNTRPDCRDRIAAALTTAAQSIRHG